MHPTKVHNNYIGFDKLFGHAHNGFGPEMVFEFVNGCACVQQKFTIIYYIGFNKLFGHAAITSYGLRICEWLCMRPTQ